jgi:hypothetical protein
VPTAGAAYEAAWARGRRMTLLEAADLARVEAVPRAVAHGVADGAPSGLRFPRRRRACPATRAGAADGGSGPDQMYPNRGGKAITTVAAHTA